MLDQSDILWDYTGPLNLDPSNKSTPDNSTKPDPPADESTVPRTSGSSKTASKSKLVRSTTLTIASPPRCDTPEDVPLSMIGQFREARLDLPHPSFGSSLGGASLMAGLSYNDLRDLYAAGPSGTQTSTSNAIMAGSDSDESPPKIFRSSDRSDVVPTEEDNLNADAPHSPKDPPNEYKKCDPSKSHLIKSSKRALDQPTEPPPKKLKKCDSSKTYLIKSSKLVSANSAGSNRAAEPVVLVKAPKKCDPSKSHLIKSSKRGSDKSAGSSQGVENLSQANQFPGDPKDTVPNVQHSDSD